MYKEKDSDDKFEKIQIRLATIHDLPFIFSLGERLFTRRKLSNLYRCWDEFEVTSWFNLQPEHMLAADIDGKVIGFAIGSLVRKSRGSITYGHLAWLGIDPDYARSGVGSLLFDRFRSMMEEAGVQMLVVDTQADNQPALDFFRGKGFTNPVEHVYMSLSLK